MTFFHHSTFYAVILCLLLAAWFGFKQYFDYDYLYGFRNIVLCIGLAVGFFIVHQATDPTLDDAGRIATLAGTGIVIFGVLAFLENVHWHFELKVFTVLTFVCLITTMLAKTAPGIVNFIAERVF